MSQDMKDETNVLSAIQLVEDFHCRKNIYYLDQSAKETTLGILKGQQLIWSLLSYKWGYHMREVDCASNFGGKVAMQTR